MNKAEIIRKETKLSQTKLGKLFIGNKQPYRSWRQLEATGKWRASTDKMFDMILILIKAKKQKVSGSQRALTLICNAMGEQN